MCNSFFAEITWSTNFLNRLSSSSDRWLSKQWCTPSSVSDCFVGTKELHRKQNVRTGNGNQKEKDSDAIKARKGVVKMLIASVLVYFISYAPTQVPLFYNVISPVPFSQKWSFLVLVMTLGYVNSAANPILYMIFSQKFRQKFFYVLVSCLGLRERYMKLRKPPASEFSGLGESQFTSRTRFIGGRNTQTSALISEC